MLSTGDPNRHGGRVSTGPFPASPMAPQSGSSFSPGLGGAGASYPGPALQILLTPGPGGSGEGPLSHFSVLMPLIYCSRNSGCASLSAPLEQEGFCHFSFLCDSSLPPSQSRRPAPWDPGRWVRGRGGGTGPRVKPRQSCRPLSAWVRAACCSSSVWECRPKRGPAGGHFLAHPRACHSA